MNQKKRFRFYMGRPVKRMRQGRHGLVLTFVSPSKGVPGEQLTVSQDDWDKYGEWREFEYICMEDMRKLASH